SALTARLLGPANRAARRQRSTRACRSASRSSNVSPARTTSTLLRALSRFLSSSIRRLSSSWIINGFPIGPRSISPSILGSIYEAPVPAENPVLVVILDVVGTPRGWQLQKSHSPPDTFSWKRARRDERNAGVLRN